MKKITRRKDRKISKTQMEILTKNRANWSDRRAFHFKELFHRVEKLYERYR
jgi:hypothetical protein